MWLTHAILSMLLLPVNLQIVNLRLGGDHLNVRVCRQRQPEPSQNIFCKAHFVIQVRVLNVRGRGVHYRYLIDVQRVFKMVDSLGAPRVKMNRLWNRISDCCARKFLLQNKVYIVSGHFSGRRLLMDSCGSIVLQRKEVTKVQMWNFSERYLQNCQCEVSVCQYADRCNQTDTSCPATFSMFTCCNKFSICQHTGGKCQWMTMDRDSPEYDDSCEIRSDLPSFSSSIDLTDTECISRT